MNLQQLSKIFEAYTPTGYTYWAGGSRAAYNIEKQISDTLLVVLPNPFPVKFKDQCWHKMSVSFWFGKLVPIKRNEIGEQQHDPYSPLELRSGMYDVANDYFAQLNTSPYIQLAQEQLNGSFYDSPDGKSVNRQVWLEVNVDLKVYSAGEGFDYFFDVHLK